MKIRTMVLVFFCFIENYFMENDGTADLGKLCLSAGMNLDIVERI